MNAATLCISSKLDIGSKTCIPNSICFLQTNAWENNSFWAKPMNPNSSACRIGVESHKTLVKLADMILYIVSYVKVGTIASKFILNRIYKGKANKMVP